MSSIQLLHYIDSHVAKHHIGMSEGLNAELLGKISSHKPEFDVLSADLGDRCLFQTKIDEDYVAIGRAEVEKSARDRGNIIHEHIILLTAQEYSQIQLPPKLLHKFFIDYNTFLSNFANQESLPPLLIDSSLDCLPEFIIPQPFQNQDALASLLEAMCLLATPETRDIGLELGSIKEATDFLFLIMFLLPPDLRPYISFLVGMQPKRGGESFNLQVRVGKSRQFNRIRTSNSELPGDLADAAIKGDRDIISACHEQFRHFRDIVSPIIDDSDDRNRKLNAKALEMYGKIDAVKVTYSNEIKRCADGGDLSKALRLSQTLQKELGDVDAEKLKNEIYEISLNRAQHLHDKGDMKEALALVKEIEKEWGVKDDLTRLECEIGFLYCVRTEDAEKALKLLPFDQGVDYLERLLNAGKIHSKALVPFFSAPDREENFAKLLNPAVHPRILMEFAKYRWNRELESLTEEGLRQDRHLVRKLIESAEKLAEKYQKQKRASAEVQYNRIAASRSQMGMNDGVREFEIESQRPDTILDIAKAIHKSMDFDTYQEMELLLDWRTEDESLFYIFPRVILEFRSRVGNDTFQDLITEYLDRVIKGVVNQPAESKGMSKLNRVVRSVADRPTNWEFAFNPADLHRVYFNVLKHRIQDMQRAATTAGDRYSHFAQMLNQIESKLTKNAMELPGPISRPEKQAAQARHDVSSTQHRSLKEVFNDEKLFWGELVKKPDLMRQKLSEVKRGEQQAAKVSEIIKRMEFDPQKEMGLMIEPVGGVRSLFSILPDIILDLGPKVSSGEFEELVTMYINQVRRGMLVEQSGKGKWPFGKPKTEFALPHSDLYAVYSKELQKAIEKMIKSKRQSQSDGKPFSQAVDELQAMIDELEQYQGGRNTKNG